MVELVGSRDTTTRGTALNTLAAVYKLLGDEIWHFMGKEITDLKVKDLIHDKFRFTEKQMEKNGARGRPQAEDLARGGAAGGLE